MELPATFEPQVTFQDLPTEILANIFVETLPDDALEKSQPNVRISPMLLCQVCSRWRSIALQLPRLWMCLYHLVRVPSFVLTKSGFLNRGIHPISREFLEWWWCNLGKNYPFHFRFHSGFERSSFNPKEALLVPKCFDPGKAFVQDPILVTLFNLAQHLDIDHHKAWMVHRCPELTFPNLETLRIRKDPNASFLPQKICALRSEPPIPKLHFQDFDLRTAFLEKPTISWSSLTHLVFDAVRLSSFTWFDLIRSCVNLEFGHFELRLHYYYSEDLPLPNPPYFTHLHLRRLVIGWHDYERDCGQIMLKNLFLPSLTAFRIFARLTAPMLHHILESTPSLVELHLGRDVAPNHIWDLPYHDEDRLPDSLSKYAPNLRHLVVQIVYIGEPMKDIIDNVFSSRWLQLEEPTNNVRTLEIQTSRYLVMDLRRELDVNVKLAHTPIHGLKVTVVADDEPMLWESYTISDKSSFRHFEEANFGGHRHAVRRLTRADSEEYW